ncbi:Plasmodium exported protein, unknown function [Plasmodium relictum]|uniref:Plasmodium RESA N-terminal domain-containing protein n=1 Tax=Plasmodium relictum TaxID=85471 RepID=A0A1J1GK72_PLARL|nr:Plasmodium exported protein, unknown function [Plasmodium relictum]CRG84725.1 Plasmodium exported protein, unknown function [Plasmodium relictum]
MIYFEGLNCDLRKYLLDSNSATIKNDYTNSYIDKGEIAKKKSCMIPINLKLFAVLFLGLLYFLLGCLFKEENLQISVPKFNKDHLRTLVEKESENVNKLVYLDNRYKNFEKKFNKFIVSLIRNILNDWEDMCYNNNIRLSPFGRIWEQEKFEYMFNKILQDTKDIYDKISEEYRIFKKSYHTDKEYSTFFKEKKKDLNKFKEKNLEWISKFSDLCKKEWKYIESSRNFKIRPLRSLFKKKKNYEMLWNKMEKYV